MGLLVFVALLSVTCSVGSAAVIDTDGAKQELYLWQEKLDVLSNLLHSECSHYVEKRAIESELVMPADIKISAHIKVAKEVYNNLIEKYVECQKEKLKSLETLTTSTKTDTTTVKPTTAVKSTTAAKPTTTVRPTTTVKLTTTTTTRAPPYRDCQEYYERGYRKSGGYMIKLSNGNLPAFNVWCDFINNHGWTVIQRRGNQSVSFNRTWNAYKSGFGDIDDEHWMGNERIHFLTQSNQQLNILIISKSDGQKSGLWKKFTVSPESDKYRLAIDGSGYTGDLGDNFSSRHNGLAFTTSDRDNDIWSGVNCAAHFQGGWWYDSCFSVDLNRGIGDGMYWGSESQPLSLSVMRVTRD